MCNLYSFTKGQQAIRDLAGAMRGLTGNLPLLPGVFPDYPAPIVRNAPDGVRELAMARWGMPSPVFALKGRNSDPGVTNVRNVVLAALAPMARRREPMRRPVHVSFSENELQPDGSRPPVWFALDESRPLAFFAGIWTRWTSVRKVKEGETTNDLFAFLTTEPNGVVAPIHPKAMPVILTTPRRSREWLTAPAARRSSAAAAAARRRARIVARGKKKTARSREPAELPPVSPAPKCCRC